MLPRVENMWISEVKYQDAATGTYLGSPSILCDGERPIRRNRLSLNEEKEDGKEGPA